MKILVTGAKGFVGKNLVCALNNIKNNFDRTHPSLSIEEVFEYDINSSKEDLERFTKECDFVFNFAGVNRPKDNKEFMEGNHGFVNALLDSLKKNNNKCPVMLSSSLQATLVGRYDNDYGRSKKAGEDEFFKFEKEAGNKVYVYRFPNLFGKWCKPNYNSVIATFCYNIAHDLAIQVNDSSTEIEFLYIDDLVNEMISLLEGKGNRCDYKGLDVIPSKEGKFYYVPVTHKVTLGRIVELLNKFNDQPNTLIVPDIKDGSFEKKLYSTYLSYLPKEKVSIPLKGNFDERGSFTELLKFDSAGQISVNISKPGITKGEHWHNSKWEFFIVVKGHALIQERRIGDDEIIEFEVSGDNLQAVHMLPGYTHNIINLSETEELITIMWANEKFDKNHPDTFFEKVKK